MVKLPTNKRSCNFDGGEQIEMLTIFAQPTHQLGAGPSSEPFKEVGLEMAHWFILNNCNEIEPFIEQHEALMKTRYHLTWIEIHR